jgi:hypothetical protein
MDELRAIVATEGTTINQFINVAVAEKRIDKPGSGA